MIQICNVRVFPPGEYPEEVYGCYNMMVHPQVMDQLQELFTTTQSRVTAVGLARLATASFPNFRARQCMFLERASGFGINGLLLDLFLDVAEKVDSKYFNE